MHFKWGIALSLPLAMFHPLAFLKGQCCQAAAALDPSGHMSLDGEHDVFVSTVPTLSTNIPEQSRVRCHFYFSWTHGWPGRISHIYLGSKPKQNAFLQLLLDRSFSPAPVCAYWAHQKKAVQCGLSVAYPNMSSCSGCWSLQFAGALAPKYRHTPCVNMDTFGGPKQQSRPQKASDSDPSSLPRNIKLGKILQKLLPWSNGTRQDWCRDWSLPGGWTESKTVQRRQISIWKQDWWEGTGTKK